MNKAGRVDPHTYPCPVLVRVTNIKTIGTINRIIRMKILGSFLASESGPHRPGHSLWGGSQVETGQLLFHIRALDSLGKGLVMMLQKQRLRAGSQKLFAEALFPDSEYRQQGWRAGGRGDSKRDVFILPGHARYVTWRTQVSS